MSDIIACLECNPVIAAIMDDKWQAALENPAQVIFYISANLLTIGDRVREATPPGSTFWCIWIWPRVSAKTAPASTSLPNAAWTASCPPRASRANSGIVHGGYDPVPGTLKAKLNTQGVELLFAAAKELNVPCRRNGSMVCTFSKEETCVIGDRIYTDVKSGLNAGVTGILVMSGETTEEILAASPDKPHLVLQDAGEILTALKNG